MKKLLLAILLVYACKAVAQPGSIYSYEYKKVIYPELMQASYPDDPDADAVVIFHKGDYRFVSLDNGNIRALALRMATETKIKIYNEEGLKYAIISIPFDNQDYDAEMISVRGATYNPDGGGGVKRHKLKKSDVTIEKLYENYCTMTVKFPNVRPGSVIELKCVIESPLMENIRPWHFRYDIPVIHSLLNYHSVPFYSYKPLTDTIMKFDRHLVNESHIERSFDSYRFKETVHTYEINNVRPFGDKISEIDNVGAGYLDFQLTQRHNFAGQGHKKIARTDVGISQNLLKDPNFGKFMDASEKEGEVILSKLNLAGKTDLEKLESITEYISSSYLWNGRRCKTANRKLALFLKNGEGNSAEINLFLAGVLKAAGLDAKPLVLSDRPGGVTFENYPFSVFTDSVIVRVEVDGKLFFVDATSTSTITDKDPSKEPGMSGLIVGGVE